MRSTTRRSTQRPLPRADAKRGMKQKEVAAAAGVYESYIADFEG